MAVQPSKCSLDLMLQSILSTVNAEQNAAYSPKIFESQFNTVTSLLISKLVKEYPDNPMSLDMLDPYMKFALQPLQNSTFTLPSDYRDILGAPYVYVNKNNDGECGNIPPITTPQQFLKSQLKGGCRGTPITIVSQGEFAQRIDSTYKKPTHKNPIGTFIGQKTVKICPFDLTRVAILYVMQEPTYVYGYDSQPDDTFVFNLSKSTESLWTSAAFEPIFKALCSLYAAYVKDNEMTQWAVLLHEQGIL